MGGGERDKIRLVLVGKNKEERKSEQFMGRLNRGARQADTG